VEAGEQCDDLNNMCCIRCCFKPLGYSCGPRLGDSSGSGNSDEIGVGVGVGVGVEVEDGGLAVEVEVEVAIGVEGFVIEGNSSGKKINSSPTRSIWCMVRPRCDASGRCIAPKAKSVGTNCVLYGGESGTCDAAGYCIPCEN